MSLSARSSSRQEQPSNLESQTFDYNALDSETRIFLQERARDIKGRLRSNARNAWEIGHDLVEVRQRLQYGHFVSWLRGEFEWSERTAYNYINVFESFGSFANFAKLETTAAPSALYLLAAPSTPFDARAEALELVNGGKSITYKEAKAIVTRHKEALKSKNTSPVTASASAAFEGDPSTLALKESIEPAQETQQSLDGPDAVDEHDGRDWVRVRTVRPHLSQWNGRVGPVVARPRGSVYVALDSFTLSFLESEVELLDGSLPDDSQQLAITHASSEEALPGKELEPGVSQCEEGNQFGEEKKEGGLIPQINLGASTLNPRTLPLFSKSARVVSRRGPAGEFRADLGELEVDEKEERNCNSLLTEVDEVNEFEGDYNSSSIPPGSKNSLKTSPVNEFSSGDRNPQDSSDSPKTKDELENCSRSTLDASELPETKDEVEVDEVEVGGSDQPVEPYSPETGAQATALISSASFEIFQTEPEFDRASTVLSPQDLVPEPKSKDKQLLPSIDRNSDAPKDTQQLAPAALTNRAALTQGIPEAAITELAIAIQRLAPEQLATVIFTAANGLSHSQLEAVISAAKQVLDEQHNLVA